MKICRFKNQQDELRVGLVADDQTIIGLAPAGGGQLSAILQSPNSLAEVERLAHQNLPRLALSEVRLCAPIERQEVWAAGVTYLRSKTARMAESLSSATSYDRVYGAERPELFFKALPEKVVGPKEPVGIRQDADWNVPEPELALVLNSRGQIVGHTIANDMSSRDIEGENLLYLPQAKIYNRSCALGPWIALGTPEAEVREWTIALQIQRGPETVFTGQTSVGQIKRPFDELASYLFRCQSFPQGAVLLTGTGIVPPDNFTLRENDEITITISGIGTLTNTVIVV